MGWVTLLTLIVFTVCAAAILSGRRNLIRTALRATTLSTAIASLYGICQYFDIDPQQDPAGYHAHAGDFVIVRPPGTMGTADYFGWWLAVALFCVVALARSEAGPWRLACRITAALCMIAIIFTGTRASIAVLVGYACMSFAGGLRQYRRPLLLVAASLALFAGFYLSPPGERLRARVHWAMEEPLGGARPLLWRDSLRLAAAHPLPGTGPETFAAAFPAWQSTDLSRLVPDFYHESPHNALLDALTEQGLPGALLLLCWVGLGLYAGRRACRAGEAAAPALRPNHHDIGGGVSLRLNQTHGQSQCACDGTGERRSPPSGPTPCGKRTEIDWLEVSRPCSGFVIGYVWSIPHPVGTFRRCVREQSACKPPAG